MKSTQQPDLDVAMQLTVIHQPSTPAPTPTAADNLTAWISSSSSSFHSFHSWLIFLGRAPRTKQVYLAMFAKFLDWLEQTRGKGLAKCTADDVAEFVGQVSQRHHRRRYIKLISDVYGHLASLGWRGDNPAWNARRDEKARGRNDSRFFLGEAEREVVMRHIEDRGDGTRREENEENGRRNQAIVAAVAGAGMRVSELFVITVNCIDTSGGWITAGEGHVAPILPFARQVLADWCGARQGTMPLFDPMSHSTAYRIVNAFFQEAGLGDEDDARLCPQTLRNTYAAILMDKGYNNPQLKMALGLAKVASAANLRMEYGQFKGGRDKLRRPKPKRPPRPKGPRKPTLGEPPADGGAAA